MAKNKTRSRSSLTLSQNAAYLAFAWAAIFLILLVSLHVFEPQFNPSWRMISEYELGQYGWMMQLGFFCLGLSCAAMLVALWRYVGTRSGRIGLALLAAVGIIGAGAGVFITDAITSPATFSGNMHTVCGLIFIFGFPIAVTLIGRSLARDPAFASMGLHLLGLTAMVWIGFLAFILSLIIFVPINGGFGPNVLIGWPDRLMAITYAAWLVMIGWITRWRIK